MPPRITHAVHALEHGRGGYLVLSRLECYRVLDTGRLRLTVIPHGITVAHSVRTTPGRASDPRRARRLMRQAARMAERELLETAASRGYQVDR